MSRTKGASYASYVNKMLEFQKSTTWEDILKLHSYFNQTYSAEFRKQEVRSPVPKLKVEVTIK